VKDSVKVLVVEDSEDDARLAMGALRSAGFDASYERVDGAAAMQAALVRPGWDAVIADYRMPGFSGLEALAILKASGLDIPFILVSGTIGEDTVVEAMTAGASDYVMKSDLWRLAPALERELQEAAMRAEHRRAQRELAESEERFRSLAAMSSDFYWETDTEHRITQRDPGSKPSAVREFHRNEQFGRRRWELPYLSPDEAGWRAHRAALDAHLPFRGFEISRPGMDGAPRHITLSGDPMFDACGAFKGYRGVGSDFTNRKQAEIALHSNTERLQMLVESSPLAIYTRDADGLLTTWNPAAERLYGWKASEVLGRPLPSVPDDARAESDGLRRRLLAGEPFIKYEGPRRQRDGSTVHIDAFLGPLHDASGNISGIVAIVADVTEQKRAQEDLRAAEEQFRGLVEQALTGIYIIQDGRLAYVNQRFAEIFGYAAAGEMIGLDPLSLVVEADRGTVAENLRRCIEGEVQSLSYTFAGVRGDGPVFDAGVHGSRATHHGKPAVIGLIQDISEKKRAEEQIGRYVAQLERAFMRTVEVATSLSEMRDPYTAGHERRVAEIAVAIGAELGFDARRREGLRVAGYLHDIGKIAVPTEILAKPGRLSAAEFTLIQAHPQAGYEVLKGVEFPWPVAEVVLQHHERLDGSGYPRSLKGEAILLEARIMAVADVVEAMSSHRPYRPGLGIDKALAEIERGRGSVYDTAVADACLKLFREKAYAIPG
jgi:PAS domain S-box-containing protein/putative nucleotidyltransferase with HDIG domain